MPCVHAAELMAIGIRGMCFWKGRGDSTRDVNMEQQLISVCMVSIGADLHSLNAYKFHMYPVIWSFFLVIIFISLLHVYCRLVVILLVLLPCSLRFSCVLFGSHWLHVFRCFISWVLLILLFNIFFMMIIRHQQIHSIFWWLQRHSWLGAQW